MPAPLNFPRRVLKTRHASGELDLQLTSSACSDFSTM